MTAARLLLASLAYHWRMNWAVGLGVVAGTAVLSGALVVGDSVRGSLRRLTLDRLGRIDEALVANRFFRSELADEVERAADLAGSSGDVVGTIVLEGSLTDGQSKARASGVTLVGGSAKFWELGEGGPARPPGAGEVVLNEPLAWQLGVTAGDEVVVRLPQPSEIPSDSPLGRKTETVGSRRLRVSEVIAAEGLGRFGLRANQQVPKNAYLDVEALADAAGAKGKINALLAAKGIEGKHARESGLQGFVRPKLADVGLRLEAIDRGYFNVTSDRMLLEPAVERAVLTALGSERGLGREADGATAGRGEEGTKGHGGAGAPEGDSAQEVLTYLANYISAGADDRGKIPYSTVAALEVRTQPPLGPFKTVDGETIEEIEAGEIVLNSWAAEDLARQGVALEAGAAIKLTYFEPDSTHGEVREAIATFRLRSVVALEGSAADRALTPELKGVTDEESLADWNPPFPYDPQRVRSTPPNDQDEKYWDEYRATPKAFISLEAGRRLWASRFGRTTSLRIPAGPGVDEAQLVDRIEAELARNAATVGFAAMPVKEEGLAAAAGTTAFNMLFLGFSFFIIAAAVMLVALLFRLGLEQRASEIGLLTAVGLRPGQVRALLLGEGLVVAATSGVVGAAAGVGYAWLMLAGLRTPGWWLSAVSTPFLRLYVTPASLLIGYASGVLVSVGAIGWGIWQMRRVSVRRLLNNQAEELQPAAGGRPRPRARLSRTVAGGAFALAVAAAAGAMWLREEARAGAFFGSGALVLAALLTMVWSRLKEPDTAALVSEGGWPVARLAARNGARHPGRSTLTIGLVAAASFLIVAISAFRLDPPEAIHEKNSGSGGFALLAQSAQPIYHDLDSEDGRLELGFSQADSQELAKTRTISLRVRPGDDASCLNLYQPSQPRVLGVPQRLIARGGFAWKETAASSEAERNNPWLLLEGGAGQDRQGDKATRRQGETEGRMKGGWGEEEKGGGGARQGDKGTRRQGETGGRQKAEKQKGDSKARGRGGEATKTDTRKEGSDTVPVVLDANTATYSLHLAGVGSVFEIGDGHGGVLKLEVVGLLKNSMLQGDLLISEKAFLKHFPQTSGYRFFLVETEPTEVGTVLTVLEEGLEDYGFDAVRSEERLNELMAVQNTYLSTFQSLGGLGLLLGMFGLAVVQLRNVLERRGELALLRAAGFRRSLLARLVLLENWMLVAGGLGVGVVAALVAVLPHLFGGGAGVPWGWLALTLAVVLGGGMLAGLAAVRAAMAAAIVPALRGE